MYPFGGVALPAIAGGAGEDILLPAELAETRRIIQRGLIQK